MITAQFQEVRDGQLKTIAFYAKRARGLMARFVIRNRIEDPAELQGFAAEGYRLRPELSSDDRVLFARRRPAA